METTAYRGRFAKEQKHIHESLALAQARAHGTRLSDIEAKPERDRNDAENEVLATVAHVTWRANVFYAEAHALYDTLIVNQWPLAQLDSDVEMLFSRQRPRRLNLAQLWHLFDTPDARANARYADTRADARRLAVFWRSQGTTLFDEGPVAL